MGKTLIEKKSKESFTKQLVIDFDLYEKEKEESFDLGNVDAFVSIINFIRECKDPCEFFDCTEEDLKELPDRWKLFMSVYKEHTEKEFQLLEIDTTVSPNILILDGKKVTWNEIKNVSISRVIVHEAMRKSDD